MNQYAVNSDPRRIIRKLMETRGYKSARELATKAGVAQSSLSRYLSGTASDLEMATWRALADTFDVTVSQLLGESPIHHDASVQQVLRTMEKLPEAGKQVVAATVQSLADAMTASMRASSEI